ncbi:hypothetical protein BGZ94_004636 [Podila epigama]|nr:hypothetical protein BGZ94_004636 [Podila epigama]
MILSHRAYQVPDESIELCIPISAVSPAITIASEPRLVPWSITLKNCPAFQTRDDTLHTEKNSFDAVAEALILSLDPGVPVVDYALQTLVRSYKQIHVFSPKLERDIATQPITAICEAPIQREFHVLFVILDRQDIIEDEFFHLQIWLTVLLALRKDEETANVIIKIREDGRMTTSDQYPGAQNDASGKHKNVHREYDKGNKNDLSDDASDNRNKDDLQRHTVEHDTLSLSRDSQAESPLTGQSPHCQDYPCTDTGQPILGTRQNTAGVSSTVPNLFRAHKSVLEINPYFNRMLNSGFKESLRTMTTPHQSGGEPPEVNRQQQQATFDIALSDSLFPAKTMGYLLDYLYCQKPFPEDDYASKRSCRNETSTLGLSSSSSSRNRAADGTLIEHVVLRGSQGSSLVHQVPEAGQTVSAPSSASSITPSSLLLLYEPTAAAVPLNHSPPQPLDHLVIGLNEWGSLYRASQILELPELEAMALQRVRNCLDEDTAMDEFMDWGYRHEAVKAIMMDFLVQRCRAVFGSDADNQLRPYLYADYEDQVESLVQLTSRIARK